MMLVPDDDIPFIIEALDHRADYLRATQRDEQPFRVIAERLKRKGPGKEEAAPKVTRKRG